LLYTTNIGFGFYIGLGLYITTVVGQETVGEKTIDDEDDYCKTCDLAFDNKEASDFNNPVFYSQY